SGTGTNVTANADGTGLAVTVGFQAAQTVVTSTLAPSVGAFTESGGSLSGSSINFAANLNQGYSGNGPSYAKVRLGGAALLAGITGATATAGDSPTVKATVGSGTTITGPGALSVTSAVYQQAQADGLSASGGIGIGVGLVEPTA